MRWLLSAAFVLLFAAACGSGSSGAPVQRGTYIALGDSLSEGVGASDPATTAFVPLVHASLGEGFQLVNLGHSGDTSSQLIGHGHLDQAISEIRQRQGDADPDNDVKLVTLEIGGNDLLNLYFDLVLGGTCPNVQVSLERKECVQELETALRDYAPNLSDTLARLREADPEMTILLLTLYNPFSGGLPAFDELGQLGLEGIPDTPFTEGLNDIIRAQAEASGVILADVYPLFQGKASEYIAGDFIHPNDTGHRVMADAVIRALGGVPQTEG